MARLKDTEINGNLVVTGDLLNKDGVDLATAFSNPNLLINSDFRNPINQRGKTSYTGSGNPYTIDRWRSFSSYVEIVDGGIKISNETTQAETYFAQTFEQNISGKYTVTVSVKEKSEHSVAVYCNGTSYNYLHQGVNTFLLEGQNLYNLALAVVTGGYIVIEYIKLEQGSIATPFVPRPYAEELALCQRYYYKIAGSWISLGVGVITNNGDAVSVPIHLPTTMRTAPTVNDNSHAYTVYTYNGLTNATIRSISFKANTSFVTIDFLLNIALTKLIPASVMSSSGLSLSFDAEIY